MSDTEQRTKNNTLRNCSLTYADIPGRLWALERPYADTIFNSMPPDMALRVKKAYLAPELDPYEASEILEYLVGNSEVSRIITEAPSSAHAFEFLYKEKPAVSAIDRYYIESPAGSHVEKRLQALQRYLPKFIRQCLNGGKVLVDNIGSGPGHDMLRVLRDNPDFAQSVHVVNGLFKVSHFRS